MKRYRYCATTTNLPTTTSPLLDILSVIYNSSGHRYFPRQISSPSPFVQSIHKSGNSWCTCCERHMNYGTESRETSSSLSCCIKPDRVVRNEVIQLVLIFLMDKYTLHGHSDRHFISATHFLRKSFTNQPTAPDIPM